MPIIVLGEKLYSLKETAEMLGVTERTLYYYLDQGRIRAQKIARVWRFSEKNIHDFIQGEVKSGA